MPPARITRPASYIHPASSSELEREGIHIPDIFISGFIGTYVQYKTQPIKKWCQYISSREISIFLRGYWISKYLYTSKSNRWILTSVQFFFLIETFIVCLLNFPPFFSGSYIGLAGAIQSGACPPIDRDARRYIISKMGWIRLYRWFKESGRMQLGMCNSPVSVSLASYRGIRFRGTYAPVLYYYVKHKCRPLGWGEGCARLTLPFTVKRDN